MPDQSDDQITIVIGRLKKAVDQNDKDEADAVGQDQVRRIQNATVGRRGLIQTRGGATLVADDKGANAIDGLGHFYPEGGSKLQLMEANGSWFSRTAGSNWGAAIKTGLTGGRQAFYIVAGKRIFRGNGQDNAHSFDGSTVTDEGNTNTSVPQFDFGIYHLNRLIVGQKTNSSIFISNTLATQTFDRSANVLKPDDQDNNLGTAMVRLSLSSISGFLYFKERSSFFINTSNSSISNWSISVVDPVHGCVATRTAVYIGSGPLQGGVLYLSREGSDRGNGVYRVRSIIKSGNDAIQPGAIISESLSLSDINESQEEKCAGFFFDNRYFLAVPSGSSSVNNKIFMLDFDVSIPSEGIYRWVELDGWSPALFDIFIESSIESLYYGESSADTIVLKAFTGTTDNGTAITTKIIGRSEDGEFPQLNKVWEFVEVFFKSTDDSTATVRAIFDNGSATTLGTVSLVSSGLELPQQLPFALTAKARISKKFPLDSQISRTVTIEVEHLSSGDRMEYLGYILTGWAENLSFRD